MKLPAVDRLARTAAGIERAPRYWVAAVLAFYFAGAAAKPHHQPLWFDEIGTDAISRASPWHFGAIAGFLLLPLAMVVGTKLTSGAFMWRYALPATDTLPIVVAKPLTFPRVLRCSPPDVIPRLRYLTDRAAIMQLPDFVPELTLAAARVWAPFPVEEYAEFTKREGGYWIDSTGDATLEWLR